MTFPVVRLCTAVLLSLLFGLPAFAALDSVSGLPDPGNPTVLTEVRNDGLPADVAISLANGFPIWYQDTSGIKLDLCIEQQVVLAGGGVFRPCITAEPILTNPISFPINFGAEAFYWSASAASIFNSTTGAGSTLLVMGQEAGFLNGITRDGDQIVFGRTRLRITVPVPGDYQVDYPFGTRVFTVASVLGERSINQTLDNGILNPLNFLVSLNDGPVPPLPPAPLDPSIDEGIVNLDGRSIGPFLEPEPANRLFDVNGNQYLNDPGTELVPIEVPIQAGPGGAIFSVTLLNPPVDFLLDADGIDGIADNTVTVTNFQVLGKVFNDGPNLAPVAVDDTAVTSPGTAVIIEVVGNDTDPVAIDLLDPFNPGNPANTNVHGVNIQALGIVDAAQNQILRTATFTTAKGATVRRITDLPTGRARFLYTPVAGPAAVGDDSFTYVIQDKGGLISAPATVTVLVEDLTVDRAEYRPRLGKWLISGTSSDTLANTITLQAGPRALLTGDGVPTPVVTSAVGTVALGVTPASIAFRLAIEPLPASAVTSVQIHAGAPGTDGPAIFSLFNSAFQGAFPGSVNGTLTSIHLVTNLAAGITSFADAINAITSGNAYVNVTTAANPGGEIRGQLTTPVIGTVPVGADGTWSFKGKSTASPGAMSSITATSTNGIQVVGRPLVLR
jgi:hypothetical protein